MVPISASAFNTGDVYYYKTDYNYTVYYNGNVNVSNKVVAYERWVIKNYNNESKIASVEIMNQLSPALSIAYSDINICKTYLYYTITTDDFNNNNYSEYFHVAPIFKGIIFYNSSKVLDDLSKNVQYTANRSSLLTLVSYNLDLEKRTYSAILDCPVENKLNIFNNTNYKFIKLVGKATINLQANISETNVLNYINSDYTISLSNATYGNVIIKEFYHIYRIGASVISQGFDMNSLNVIIPVSVVGVIALVVGFTIGRKY